MADFIAKFVDILAKLFTFMTLGRTGILALLLLMGGVTIAFLDNKPQIYGAISLGRLNDAPIPDTIKKETQLSLVSVVDRYENIVGVEVIQITLRRNTRRGIYFYSDQPPLLKGYENYQKNKAQDTPLFVTGDTEVNDRLAAIIEQEMICVELPKNTIKAIPISAAYVKAMCSLSIPPDFGKLAGWLNIWLKEPIDKTAYSEYKQVMRALSSEIYRRDVQGDPR